MSNFYKFKNIGNKKAELYIEGPIVDDFSGMIMEWWDVTHSSARKFKDDLKGIGNVDEIIVKINSGGGDVFAADFIASELRQHSAKVTTQIEGLAASAASVIAMAGDERLMSKSGMLMIHNPSILMEGEVKDLEKGIELLDKVKQSIINSYETVTGLARDTISNMMDEVSWMYYDEAIENGFVNGEIPKGYVSNNNKMIVTNNLDFINKQFKNVPPNLEELFNRNFPKQEIVGMGNESKNKKEKQMATENNTNSLENIKTVKDLANKFSNLVKEIEDNAKTEERGRIQDISAISSQVSDELAKDAMFENPISASDLSLKAMKENAKLGNRHIENTIQSQEDSGMNDIANIPEQNNEANIQNKKNGAFDMLNNQFNARRTGGND